MRLKLHFPKLHMNRLHTLEQGLALTCVFVLLVAAALYVPATVYVSSSAGPLLPIRSVERDDKKIALTFDTAWHNDDTGSILSILEKYQVRATFFVTGSWVASYPDEVKAIARAGHDLGNHSQNHPEFDRLSEEKIKEELLSVHEQVKELTGQDMTLFRPPYGKYNNQVITTANECGYTCIEWDVDSMDWRDYGTESIIQTVTQNTELGSGSIIWMHTGTKYTKDALEAVILSLQEAGYEFVPVSELIYRDGYRIDSMGRQVPN